MSLADTRQEIADALDAVAGITGYTEPPSIMQAGDAWALLASLQPAGPNGLFIADWRCIVVLGGTQLDAIDFLDQVLDDVIEAITPVGYVSSVGVVQLQIGQNSFLPAAELRLTRE